MTLHASILNLLLFVSVASAKLLAEIPCPSPFDKIAKACGKHFFIETAIGNLNMTQKDNFVETVTRLNLLNELIAMNNQPPDLVSALQVAVPTAQISIAETGGIRVLDTAITGNQSETLDSRIKVREFSGKISKLLSALPLKLRKIWLDDLIYGDRQLIDDLTIKDFTLKAYSFDGSLRGLLTDIAIRDGRTTSYFAVFGPKGDLAIRFFSR